MEVNQHPLRMIASMSVRRERAAYPVGPRRPMTNDWKRIVLRRLDENKRQQIQPRDKSELAEMIGVHKTAITKMLWIPGPGDADSSKGQHASALVDKICETLRIRAPYELPIPAAPAMQLVPEMTGDKDKPTADDADGKRQPDALDQAISWIPEEERERAAAILRAAFGPLRKPKTRDQ